MKCQQCLDDGKKSTVDYHGGFTTAMCTRSFYDEDGRYHFHDPNAHSDSYTCSNGHRFTKTEYHRCRVEGCDFNANKTGN